MRHIPEQSIHHDFIKSAIPAWFTHAAPQRVRALKDTLSSIPAWAKTASAIEHAALKLATEASWRSQNDVDRMLREVQDAYAFAQPLLSQALKDQYGIEVDVRETFLKLYSPVKLSPWVLNVMGESVVEPSLYWMRHCIISPSMRYFSLIRNSLPGPTNAVSSRSTLSALK